jgi:hypothetical protein
MVPVNTPTPSGPQIFWSTSFESGDLRDLTPFGDFINQGSGTYNIVNQPVHAGNYAAALTIDTLAYSETGSHASYLFFWDDLPGDAYYYSAWYYLPAGVKPQDWWNVWQWKSTYDGDSDNSERIFSIGIQEEGGILFPDLNYRLPGMDNISYKQYAVSVPVDQWFQLEAYYIKSMSDTGQIIVWLNGQEVFNIQNVQTALADNTLYWSVNNYTDSIIPNKYTLFVDDIAISLDRLSRFK